MYAAAAAARAIPNGTPTHYISLIVSAFIKPGGLCHSLSLSLSFSEHRERCLVDILGRRLLLQQCSGAYSITR
jgi:hypothetical protein